MAYPYDDEDKRAALTQGLLAAGLAALGARKGSEYNALGQAGLLGITGYNTSLRDATNAREQQAALKMRQEMYDMQKAQWEEQQRQARAQQAAAAGAFTGGHPAIPGGEAEPREGGMTPGLPAYGGQFNPQAYVSALQQQGLPMQAIAAAEKYAPKPKELKEQRTLTQNGKRVTVNVYKDGSTEVVPFAPDLEKPHFVSTGAKVGVPLDPFTGKPLGEGVQATMAPADAARIGIDRQRLGLEQQRFAREGAGGADKWVNDLDRGVQISMATGDTRPITSGGQPIGTKKDTKLVDGSQRALTVLDMAEGIIKNGDPTGSLAGNLYDMAAGAFGMSTAGAKSVAGLQALEGALMMAQPRMEGPQSDKDTALYKQMAGKIGDPNVPNGIKLAAVKVIRDMHLKYSANAGAPQAEQSTAKTYETAKSGEVYTAPDGTQRRKR